MEIGIIGFGQLGQFAALHLKKHFKIFAADVGNKKEEAQKIGVEFTSIEEAASKKVVILSVPINQVENTLHKIKPFLKKRTLVMDVCSVKTKPAKLMEKILPRDVDIIATHPLFGPQSGKDGIKGFKIVVCPIRTTRGKEVKKFLEELGLEVVITTPEEHDRQMAITHSLSQVIARAIINMGVKKTEISVPSFELLLKLKEMLKEDSLELFRDIELNNPFSDEIRERFLNEITKIQEGLNTVKR